jgi:Histidine kinase-, DNA gyrase B-, and HSP90-like ATPase
MIEEFNIEIGTPGIRKALNKYDTESSIAELVWNGFDAGARIVSIDYTAHELGGLDSLRVTDDGSGIPRHLLQEKFKPFLHSNKVFDPDETHYGPSAKHGKNGMGRLTFFKFASKAVWKTTYESPEGGFRQYDIEIKASTLRTITPSPETESAGPAGAPDNEFE